MRWPPYAAAAAKPGPGPTARPWRPRNPRRRVGGEWRCERWPGPDSARRFQPLLARVGGGGGASYGPGGAGGAGARRGEFVCAGAGAPRLCPTRCIGMGDLDRSGARREAIGLAASAAGRHAVNPHALPRRFWMTGGRHLRRTAVVCLLVPDYGQSFSVASGAQAAWLRPSAALRRVSTPPAGSRGGLIWPLADDGVVSKLRLPPSEGGKATIRQHKAARKGDTCRASCMRVRKISASAPVRSSGRRAFARRPAAVRRLSVTHATITGSPRCKPR